MFYNNLVNLGGRDKHNRMELETAHTKGGDRLFILNQERTTAVKAESMTKGENNTIMVNGVEFARYSNEDETTVIFEMALLLLETSEDNLIKPFPAREDTR